MSTTIWIEEEMVAELERQLELPELATFLLADFDGRDFDVTAMKPIGRDGYATRSSYHLELPDSTRPELIAWALETDSCLIEAHSHGPGFPRFSASDQLGFADWVPHVRWRLGGLPYAALVLSGRKWDGLAWIDPNGQAEAIAAIKITAVDGEPAAGGPPATTTRTIPTTQRSINDV